MSECSPFFRFWVAFSTSALALWVAESRLTVSHDLHLFALITMAASSAVVAWRVPVYEYRFRALGLLTQLTFLAAPVVAAFEASRRGYLPGLIGRPADFFVNLAVSACLSACLGYVLGRKRYRRNRRIWAIRTKEERSGVARPALGRDPSEVRNLHELTDADYDLASTQPLPGIQRYSRV